MTRQEIVERLLVGGFLVRPDTLEKITDDLVDTIISNTPIETIVIKNITNESPEFKVKNKKEKKVLKPDDYVSYYSKKYDFLKEILLKKTSPISIDKSKTLSESTIIGMVSEITQKGCLVEDQTGRIEVRCDNSKTLVNAVLGFVGKIKENIMEASSIIYPDIPLNMEIVKTNSKIILSDKKTEEGGYSNLSFEDIKTNPCFAKINGCSIFCYKPKTSIEKENALSFLKNRFIPEDVPNEKFLIKEAPSFFWIDQEAEWEENYKGVKIMSGQNIKIN